MFHPIILWTDAIIYLLIIGVFFFIRWAKKQEQLRSAWQQILQSHLAIISMVILSVYIVIGLLDSVHFRTIEKNQITSVQSLLDYLVSPLGQNDEKTYSAPFATHLYNKDIIVLPNGLHIRDFPRLKFVGLQFVNPDQSRASDIFRHCMLSSLTALAIWVLLGVFSIAIKAKQHNQRFKIKLQQLLYDENAMVWRTAIITIGIIILLAFNLFDLSRVYHIFGTDKVGQDIFYETLKSIRTGLVIGTLTTLVTVPFAILFGMLAGYFRGWVDDVIQYVYTTVNSIPDVLLIAAAVLALQIFITNHPNFFSNLVQRADARLLALCIILGLTSWTNLCRLLRGETLKLREQDYVQASVALGTKRSVILVKHILPNLMHLVVIAMVMDFSGLVLAEAVLTYVGVGVDPTTSSWGNMINAARYELAREPIVWWPLLAAFLFMFPLVICANLFADAVRDALDPRIRVIRS